MFTSIEKVKLRFSQPVRTFTTELKSGHELYVDDKAAKGS